MSLISNAYIKVFSIERGKLLLQRRESREIGEKEDYVLRKIREVYANSEKLFGLGMIRKLE